MRREGYIIEEIIDYSNMSESFDEVLRGKKRKRSRQGRYLLAHREEVIKELTEQIANGSFRVSGYRERTIHEYGKERNLQILSTERPHRCPCYHVRGGQTSAKALHTHNSSIHQGTWHARPYEGNSPRYAARPKRHAICLQV